MFDFLRRLFSKRDEFTPDDASHSLMFAVDYDDDAVCLLLNGKSRQWISWCDIQRIVIRIEDDFLPFPYWYIESAHGVMRIPNDAEDGQDLFFEGFKTHLKNYGRDSTYQTIATASSALAGEFVVWESMSR